MAFFKRSKPPLEQAGNAAYPRHIAIIMDGNGRWASERGLPALVGHRAGVKALKEVVGAAPELGISQLTIYAFSTENWQRSPEEVRSLMHLFSESIMKEVPELNASQVCLRFVGREEGVDPTLLAQMRRSEEETRHNQRLRLFVAFNYGARAEILDAFQQMINSKPELLTGEALTQECFEKALYAPDMHEPELLIRTSGEHRLSNFLLWQCAYTEFYFTETLWPDFDKAALQKALEDYSRRKRRFGRR